MGLPSREPNVLGNSDLVSFDAIVIGSGAGGSTVAYALSTNGRKVLVIETGNNYFQGLDDPAGPPVPLFSNDELKDERHFIETDPLIEPRTFRPNESIGDRTFVGDVNGLPKTVGGGAVHADMKYPRFQDWDFRLASALGGVPNANFADWPLTYDELEPFCEVEQLVGVQGEDGVVRSAEAQPPLPDAAQCADVRQPARSRGRRGSHASHPTAINSRPYGGNRLASTAVLLRLRLSEQLEGSQR
jgi:choline dehydrogenase-like flavoprotein